MGDFNCHNELWGSVTANARGRLLERWWSTNDLVLLNTGADTHFCSATGSFSCIDLTFCSPRLASDLTWSVVPDLHGSDHFPVVVRLGDWRNQPPACSRRWIFAKADWQLYAQQIKFDEVESFEGADALVEHFTSVIMAAAEVAIPRSSGKPRRIPVPWWTDECQHAIKARRRALRAFRASPTLARRLEFLRLKAIARRTVKECKRASWLSYISSMDRTTPTSIVWTKIRRLTGRKGHSSVGLSIGGTLISTPEQIATVLAETFSSVSRYSDPYFLRIKELEERKPLNFHSRNMEDYNVPFTRWELEAALSRAKDTAVGPDGIHCQFLRHLPPDGLTFLLRMLNRLWMTSSFPCKWREATIIPIPKPGKDASIPENYRPISLTSCVCKIYERMVNWRLVWFLETNNLLSNSQCGFRRIRSPIDHLVNLESYIREVFLNKQHLLAVFFDIEKAYDTSWRFGILRTLHGWGLRGRMADLISNFMRGRIFRVRVGSSLSALFVLENGVPQGSVLSVTLFAVSINPIAEAILPPVASSLFVDDLGASAAGHSVPSAERRLQLSINKAYDCARSIGYKFSSTKTTCMHFCRKRGMFPEPSLHLGSDVIPVVETTRFLGLLFDQKLTWIPHLKQLRSQCLQGINAIRVLGGTKWGSDRTILLRMYRALLRSKLDYGCFVYGSARPSALRMLDPIHHRGIRLTTGAFYTSPIPSLYAESGEPPLSVRREELFLRYAAKLAGLASHPTHAAVHAPRYEALFTNPPSCIPSAGVRLKQLLDRLLSELPLVLPISHSCTPPWLVPKCNLELTALKKQQTSDSAYRQSFYKLLSGYPDYTTAYTDGSKSADAVGCAAVCGDRTHGFRLSGDASNFTAELVAIRETLSCIVMPPGHYLVCSDSLSAIRAIGRYYPSSPLIQNVQDLLADPSRRGSVIILCWLPGHANIPGNESADKAARIAALSEEVVFPAVPHEDLFNMFRRSVRSGWDNEWSATTNNKLRVIKPTTKAWGTSFRKCRVEETALTRLRIGHCCFSHSHLLLAEESPICQCGEDLTVRHLLCECAAYEIERRCYALTGDIAETLGDDTSKVNSVLSFIRDTGFLSRM